MRFGLFIFLVLLLAGCFRTNENPVRIITVTGVTEFFPVFLAEELGHFRDEKVAISLEAVGSGSKALKQSWVEAPTSSTTPTSNDSDGR